MLVKLACRLLQVEGRSFQVFEQVGIVAILKPLAEHAIDKMGASNLVSDGHDR